MTDKFQCTRCPDLVAGRSRIVWGHGPVPAKVMFVGEAPGFQEDEVGLPFIGPAGDLLTTWIEALGLKRSDVYITNTVRCLPKDLKFGKDGSIESYLNRVRRPTIEEVRNCNPFLLMEIRTVQPRALVALGRTAWIACRALPIVQALEEANAELFRLPHPSYVLRFPIPWEADVRALSERVHELLP